MERQKKVVDASVISKWFLIEEKRDEAIKLREDHIKKKVIIIVPELIFLEILNTLKNKGGNNNYLKESNELLWNVSLFVIPLDKFILTKAIEISLEYNLTVYDAIYAALSQIYGCQLITEDEKLKTFPSSVAL